MRLNSRFSKISYAAAGLVAGGVLATTLGAQAATVSPSATTSTTTSSTATADPHPGDNGADGVPEANEVHGGALSLSGSVTAVGASSVTIKTSTATTVYAVTSASDIDKNGEATLSALVVGDKVTFSVASGNAKQIDKLHAGDETKDRPTGTAPSAPSSNAG
ncbi:MAG TPA: hypothetical protein VGN48_12415 [Pedococcus sp.]|jgi:hypothetical protein|nr:hypothetical protein [Pedococcus sp.]